MNQSSPNYIPALKFHSLTRFYDHVVRLTTRERVFKKALINQVTAKEDEKLLDVGCGTGTLIQMLAHQQPKLIITGLDADRNALNQAMVKVKSLDTYITLEHGYAQQIPFVSKTFDIATSSLFFHHLTKEQKQKTFNEIYRTLKPGGRLHIADWGKPASRYQRILFYLIQILDGFETTSDNVQGALPNMIFKAGFLDIEETSCIATPLGTIRLLKAIKPME